MRAHAAMEVSWPGIAADAIPDLAAVFSRGLLAA
jgi:hypothetical protein